MPEKVPSDRGGFRPKRVNRFHPPQFNMADGDDFVVSHPRHARKDIQQHEIRDLEVDPNKYYPKGYHPQLLTRLPVDGDLVTPTSEIPESMKKCTGEAARDRARLREAHGLEAE